MLLLCYLQKLVKILSVIELGTWITKFKSQKAYYSEVLDSKSSCIKAAMSGTIIMAR